MKKISGRHRQVLYTPPYRTTFEAPLDFVEEQKVYEVKLQQRIDNLNTEYYSVSCDRREDKIRETILSIKQEKYFLYRETEGDFSQYKIIHNHYKIEGHTLYRYPGSYTEGK